MKTSRTLLKESRCRQITSGVSVVRTEGAMLGMTDPCHTWQRMVVHWVDKSDRKAAELGRLLASYSRAKNEPSELTSYCLYGLALMHIVRFTTQLSSPSSAVFTPLYAALQPFVRLVAEMPPSLPHTFWFDLLGGPFIPFALLRSTENGKEK